MSLTIAYITCRRDPKIQWFFDSLSRQIATISDDETNIIVVDLFNDEKIEQWQSFKRHFIVTQHVPCPKFTAPKPNVWSGPYRLAKQDYFSAANARNTALCLCETDWVAFVDDLSVLMPGWLDAVKEAMAGGYIACGAYRKVHNLVVEDGVPVSYDTSEAGDDHRLRRVSEDVGPCGGDWLYGCSFAAPLEDLLEVGGFPEYCDSLGSEDCCLGKALQNLLKHFKYDRRMLTLESIEGHYVETPMKRIDKGVSPSDKSHAALRIAEKSNYFPNYYPGGMRALREHVLAGNPFPVVMEPKHDWYDSQPIEEFE